MPQPLKLFGTDELKKKYLPRCAAGEISAFALTEADVGSDPARLTTTAELTPDGDAYILNGVKLWCTNGTLAKLLVVMARDPKTKKISAFVVETAWPGVKVEHRCHFMGLQGAGQRGHQLHTTCGCRAENLIGDEGKGLKIALTTLNDGRLSIPNGSVGTAKLCLRDLPHVGRRARAVGQAGGQARGDRPQDRRHGGHHLRHGVDRRPGHRDVRPRRLRHPPGGGGRQGVEHRPHLGDRGRHHADPRRPRLRDRRLRWRRAARSRSASSG